ncbi:lysine--tRNA ligase [Maritalea porphyrae]|uniref:lysine--tRNA ligase n=1 Tax=Maritalea porphyrae TaxID=880732 RepID=UPI0022B01C0E|nr:lysine--tRNA ligase [Maritalea porphyrae]MCZ4273281.1 lysine--tRNA ligase [Maritalea porphyrae]
MANTPTIFDEQFFAAANNARAWPFEEAKKIVKRLEKSPKDVVLFQTGYGPSGLPHIGTFGEVARTSMVRNAFRLLTGDKIPSKIICYSDDMDGFRKVPTNVPNQERMAEYIGMPLTKVPDPFSDEYPSFAHHNNARLQNFLDDFGFEYEFVSSTDYYTSGVLDKALLRMLEVYDDVMKVILPTLGEERQKTYSPFLPLCPRTGKVLQVPMIARDVAAGTVTYVDPETSEEVTVPVTGGAVKCQWKADWALRWYALGIDYEMSGKDLIDSVRLSSRIVRALGGTPPESLSYELFLDENGQKISKSKGNGLSMEDWLTYASPESLALFMYQKPKTAKKLYFDVIPKAVDEFYAFSTAAEKQTPAELLENPATHIHGEFPPAFDLPISFALLLNLVSAANAEDSAVLWGFISRYAPDATPQNQPELDRLVGYAIRYFTDFVKPTKKFRAPSEQEAAAMAELATRLDDVEDATDADAIQSLVFEIGKKYEFEPLRNWFKALYQVLLGQDQGPRFGSFIALYGVTETKALIEKALAGELV